MSDSVVKHIRENQDSIELTIRKDKEGVMVVTGFNVKAYGNLQNDDEVLEGKLFSGVVDAEKIVERYKKMEGS